MRRFHAVLLFGLIGLAGCHSESPRTVLPTAPSAVAVTTGVVTTGAIRVSGKVYDTAYRPIAGAIIEVIDGPDAGMSTTSWATGEFSLNGDFEEGTRLRATREGYLEGIARVGRYCAACNPHHWAYFSLGLPVAPADIAGDYTLTISAHAACSALPAEARSRTYAAKVVPDATQPTAANTYFRAAMSGASLVPELVWEGLWIAVAGDYLELSMGDLHGQPGLLEQMGADTYFSIGGMGNTTVAAGAVTTISTAFEGEIVHCVLKPNLLVLDANGRYSCGVDRAVTRAACLSPAHRLTLTRR